MTAIPQMTFEGAAGGMNTAVSPHEIGDNQGAYIQDVLLHKPGLLARRGPVKVINTVGLRRPQGIVQTLNPAGDTIVGVLVGSPGSGVEFQFYHSDGTLIGHEVFVGMTAPANPLIIDSSPMLNGGTLIGISDSYELGGTQRLVVWNGGIFTDYSTGTITVSGAGPTKTVTGSGTSWTTSNVSPGMYLFDNSGMYIGCVKSVDSSTQLTLVATANFSVAGGSTYNLQSLRGFSARIMTGTLSTSTGSTAVEGSGTKFKSQGFSTNYDLFRATDMQYIGSVSTVANDSGLTLTGNAAISLANERYVALDRTAASDKVITTRTTRETPGFLTAIWDRKQWYGNLNQANDGHGEYTTRAWASDEANAEAVDFDPVAGDFVTITSTQGANTGLRAMAAAKDSLVLIKENEVHAVTGTTDNYAAHKIADDGTLCGMTALSWNGAVLWAGRTGVWMYDGLEPVNITENSLGDYWKSAVKTFNSDVDRMWAFIHRDHYILHLQTSTPPRGYIRGSQETIPTHLVLVIYLPKLAVSTFSNVNVRGGVTLPNGTGAWYLVNYIDGSAHDNAKICDAEALFGDSKVDDFAADGGATGPNFYFESKRYALGDGMLKKAWRWLALTYLSVGDSITLDTIQGLNKQATKLNTTYLSTAKTWFDLGNSVPTWDALANTAATWDDINAQVFQVKRVKFMKRSQYLGFRLYQTTFSSSQVVDIQVGPWALAYKPLPGKY